MEEQERHKAHDHRKAGGHGDIYGIAMSGVSNGDATLDLATHGGGQ